MRRIRKRDERGRFVARGVSPRTRSRPLLGKSEDCGEERPGIEEKQLSFAQPTAVQQTYRLPFDDGESEQWEDVDEEIDARRSSTRVGSFRIQEKIFEFKLTFPSNEKSSGSAETPK